MSEEAKDVAAIILAMAFFVSLVTSLVFYWNQRGDEIYIKAGFELIKSPNGAGYIWASKGQSK